MTVSELINELQKEDPNAWVTIADSIRSVSSGFEHNQDGACTGILSGGYRVILDCERE
jgi:hypothetical protein